MSRHSLTTLFILLAIVVALLSLWLSNRLVKELAAEERNKIEVWAMATESMKLEGDMDMSLVLRILEGNNTIPIILYDNASGKMEPRNISLPEKNSEAWLRAKMEAFGRKHDPIELYEMNQLLYYDDSRTLKMLQRYPYLQLMVISLFVGLAFFALRRSQRSERDRLWVGLSKETAHQLGTPISSLMAWLEYMKLKGIDSRFLIEIEKDISRLRMIADRFSKIGATSALVSIDLKGVIDRSLSYLEKRVSGEVTLLCRFPDYPVLVMLNEPLFGWVIENLVKNAVDAMQGKGSVSFDIADKGGNIVLDITDTGKGMAKSKFKTAFSPGYTTKERGWGLGLSLAKRIIEDGHGGQIYVLRSELGKGTTFRIVFKK